MGEGIDEVHDRARALLRALIPTVEHKCNGAHKRILLVSHAATCIALTRALVNTPTLPLRVGCCSITDFRLRDTSSNSVGDWEATKLADGTHLKEGASRDWGFEDVVIVDSKVCSYCSTLLLQLVNCFHRWLPTMENPARRMRRMSQSDCSSNSSHLASEHSLIDSSRSLPNHRILGPRAFLTQGYSRRTCIYQSFVPT